MTHLCQHIAHDEVIASAVQWDTADHENKDSSVKEETSPVCRMTGAVLVLVFCYVSSILLFTVVFLSASFLLPSHLHVLDTSVHL